MNCHCHIHNLANNVLNQLNSDINNKSNFYRKKNGIDNKLYDEVSNYVNILFVRNKIKFVRVFVVINGVSQHLKQNLAINMISWLYYAGKYTSFRTHTVDEP